MYSINSHVISVKLSDSEIADLVNLAGHISGPACTAIKRIIYQANDSPIFCSIYNKPVRHLNPTAAACQPFPLACNTCPYGVYEE